MSDSVLICSIICATALIITGSVLSFLNLKSNFKDSLSDVSDRAEEIERVLSMKLAKTDDTIASDYAELRDKIKSIDKIIDLHQNDLNQIKIQRGLTRGLGG